jgi:dCMP deaminase
MTEWDRRFLSLVTHQIAWWSKDPKQKVGAAVVSPDRRQIHFGYNGFPINIQDDYRLFQRDLKNRMIIHAEANAILNAKCDLTGWTMYSSVFSCSNCAAMIIQAGITKIVTPKPKENSSWCESHKLAIDLFDEADIEIVHLEENDCG